MVNYNSGSSACDSNIDGNAANQLHLAMNPSRQFYDKFDFKNWDPELETDYLPEEKAKYNLELIYNRITEFLISDKFTDVNIVCENQIFRCHRLVLAASCTYFEIMFSGNFRESKLEEIELHDVNVATITEILRFVYKGYCRINDKNVFGLLQASNMLGLTTVESECTRYLVYQCIPAEYAIQLFVFACNLKKNVLIAPVSQFILEHLEHLSMSAEYLEISFDDLRTLLTNFRSLSSRNERTLLEAVSRWIRHSEKNFGRRILLFDRLRQNAKLLYHSEENQQFYQIFLEDDQSAPASSASIVKYAGILNQVPIHAYVNITDDGLQYRTNIFTSKFGEDKTKIGWYSHTFSMESNYISQMRTVVIEKQLYRLQRKDNSDEDSTFSVSVSAHLSDSKILEEPPRLFCYKLLCGDKNSGKIYSYGSDFRSSYPDLLLYDRELDVWKSIPSANKVKVNCMTYHDDGRLYIFAGPSRNRSIQTYDHREGKLQILPEHNKLASCSRTDECCSFQGKIFVSSYSGKRYNAIEMFDPRSEKWLGEFEWPFETWNSDKDSPHRLVPYNNELWMFSSAKYIDGNGREIDNNIIIRTYNSFQERCFLWRSLNDAILRNVGSSSKNIIDVAII